MIYVIAALVTTTVFILMPRWTRRVTSREDRPRQRCSGYGLLSGRVTGYQPADVQGALVLALERLMPRLTTHDVQLDVAVVAGLLVQTNGFVLADVLEELLIMAIHHAPVRNVLVTAVDHGSQICISVSNDATSVSAAECSVRVNSLAERLKLCGVGLDADVRPEEGTILMLWMTSAAGGSATASRATVIAEECQNPSDDVITGITVFNALSCRAAL